jgi:hypothetical protein
LSKFIYSCGKRGDTVTICFGHSDGLSLVRGVNSVLDDSPGGFSCLEPGVSRNAASSACELLKSLQQLLLHYVFPRQ